MKIKAMIHKTTGWTAAASLAALMVNYPLRRLGLRKAHEAVMQAHEAASGAYFLSAIAHIATAAKGSKLKKLSGAAAFATSAALIADCHLEKDQSARMQRHRVFSAVLASTAALHAFLKRH